MDSLGPRTGPKGRRSRPGHAAKPLANHHPKPTQGGSLVGAHPVEVLDPPRDVTAQLFGKSPTSKTPIGPHTGADLTLHATSFGLGNALDGAQANAAQALADAGLGSAVVDVGPQRRTGLGVTVPIMQPLPSIDLARFLAEPPRTDLGKLRIAVSADHGAYGRAEQTAAILKSLGVGHVVVIAPHEGERMNYGVSTHAAIDLLERGEVDRVVSFCGNGLGALDLANQHATLGGGAAKPPLYGDNLWSIVDGRARGANVLALGARLLNVKDDPLAAFLKAFVDDPPKPAHTHTPQHGVTSKLVDPKPERIAGRTLPGPMSELVALSAEERARIEKTPTTVYFCPDDKHVPAQLKALKALLPKSVRFRAWDGRELPKSSAHERVVLLSERGCAQVSTHPWGFYAPADEPNAARRVHRAEHVSSIKSFVRTTDAALGMTLDLPASALTDKATGGTAHDVLKLFVKTFLLESASDGHAHKALYGEALEFGAAMITTGQAPPALSSWTDALAAARAGIRRF